MTAPPSAWMDELVPSGAPSITPSMAARIRAAMASDPAPRTRPSPCPEIEARVRALADAGPVEVEPDSGPLSTRPQVIGEYLRWERWEDE